MKSGYIRSLEEITKHDVRVAGGKGANLGEMYRSKLPVPEAFVVTTKAYRAFVERNGLDAKLRQRLKGISMEDVRSVEKGAAELRRIVESSDIPEDLEAEIALAYRQLSEKFGSEALAVAVRSSATTEDLRDASFAGQQTTLLNVKGVDELFAAIRKCWASVYTARATFYRAKRGFGSRTVDTAVVVQAQIMSERSGVGFTIHPITGDKTQMVIEAVYGQGEEIVSGRVVPDTFVLDKETGEVIEKRIVSKTRMKKASLHKSGLVGSQVPAGLRERQVIWRGRAQEALGAGERAGEPLRLPPGLRVGDREGDNLPPADKGGHLHSEGGARGVGGGGAYPDRAGRLPWNRVGTGQDSQGRQGPRQGGPGGRPCH